MGALASLADNTTHITMATHGTISRRSGVSKKSISRITHDLELSEALKKWRKGFRVCYYLPFKPSEWIERTGVPWDTRDKKPKKSAIYPKDPKTGRFTPKKLGNNTSENTGSNSSEENGNSLKSSTKGIVGESSVLLPE